jgi:hypothetical protein
MRIWHLALTVPGKTLSLPAELALLGFDPATCKWYKTERKRRRTAFGAAAVYQSARMPRTARGLRRLGKRTEKAALLELQLLKIVDGKRLINRIPHSRRFERLLTVMRQGELDREYDRSLIAVLAWADVLEPRLKGRSTHWFADTLLAVVGDEDEEDRDRVVEALGLACDGRVLEFLVGDEAEAGEPLAELHEPDEPDEREGRKERRLEYQPLAAQETEGARSFGS